MAFDAAGLCLIVVGPTKMWIYATDDALTSASITGGGGVVYGLGTDNCLGMNRGDIVIFAHSGVAGSSLMNMVRITNITATSMTYTTDSPI